MLQIKLRGCFYNAFNDDARVLSQVTNYEIKEFDNGTLRCGFPANDNTLNKVADSLADVGVSYIITNKEEEVRKAVFDDDRFQEYLSYFDDSRIVKNSASSNKKNNKKVSADVPEDAVIDKVPEHKVVNFSCSGNSVINALLFLQLQIVNYSSCNSDISGIRVISHNNNGLITLDCEADVQKL